MLTIDATSNYLMWPNREAVNLQNSTSGGYQAPIPISDAKRRAPTFRELSVSNGAYTGQDLVWLLPVKVTPGPGDPRAPKPGDLITDKAGAAWTVLEVALNALKSTWRCMTRNLALAFGLRDTIDIERPGITYDASGGILRSWPTGPGLIGGTVLYAAIPAKVQLIQADTEEKLGVMGLLQNYKVILGQQVVIQYADRVKWTPPSGVVTYLDVVTLTNPQRIDELPVLDCVLLP